MSHRSICMLSNLYYPVVSGSSTFIQALSRELVCRGHQVVVITARIAGSPATETIDGYTVYRLPAIRLPRMPIAFNFRYLTITYLPSNLKRVRSICEKHRFDVMNVHNHIFDMGLVAVHMKRRLNIPLVLTLHTAVYHTNPAYDRILKFLDLTLARPLIVKQADRVISPGVLGQEYLNERHGVTDSPLIPYGVDLPRAVNDAEVEALRTRYRLGKGPVILSLGHVHANRNRKSLVLAFFQILKVFPNAKLLIVGELYTQEPVDLARELGLQESVIFAGAVPHEDIPAYFALAHLEAHWLTSATYDSLGIASLEAMAAGKAVVAACREDTFGLGVLENWKNVVIVPRDQPNVIAHALVRLLKDDNLRCRIGTAARRLIQENFSWESICRRTLSVYDELIHASNHQGR